MLMFVVTVRSWMRQMDEHLKYWNEVVAKVIPISTVFANMWIDLMQRLLEL